MLKLKLLKMIMLAAVFGVTVFVALLPILPARAQGPDEPLADWVVHRWSELLGLDQGPSQGALCSTGDPLIGYAYSPGDYFLSSTAINRASDCAWLLGAFEAVSPQLDVGESAAIQFTIAGDSGQGNGYNAQWHVYTYDGSSWSGAMGNYGQGPHTVSIPVSTTQIAITYWSPFFYIGPTPYITGFQYINITPTNLTQECDTVTDPDFTGVITDAWLLDGSAVITNGLLTLTPGDVAAQNLTLDSLTPYNAVISVTGTVSDTSLDVILGTDSETLAITGTGRFTATFTTPTLGGPIAYILENSGEQGLDIDFTCLYPVFDNGQTTGCIAPTNGRFDDSSHWNYYRGAAWFAPGLYANLPVADAGMIGSTETYTMPAITGTERLLLSFTGRAPETGGVIGGQLTNGSSTSEFYFSIYQIDYIYEVNVSTLAAETNVQFSFVNPSDVVTDVVSTADVTVDNICLFIANRGPALPQPVNPDAYVPIDLGFNYTSCDDVDGLLAGFGVNIQQYRAEYEAGASIWDPIGWVPWLIAAMWNILATWLCIFMAAFVTLIDVLEYILNSLLNIALWIVRNWRLMVLWVALWLGWLADSLSNIGSTFVAWLFWIGTAGWTLYLSLGLTLVAAVAWLLISAGGVINAVFPWLYDWLYWAALSLGNLAAWLLENLLSMNGLRIIANWLIGGWNAFLPILGSVLSLILDDLIGIWNDSLWPFLADAWAWVAGFPIAILLLLIDFLFAAWDLLSTMFWWLWENIISVASTPLTFYYAFNEGVNADPYGLVSCVGDNFWCTFLAGVQLINQLIAHSILYPVIITGIILSTLWILWDNFYALFSPVEIR